MPVRVNGGPYFLEPGQSLSVGYYWGATPEHGANRGGRYAYAVPTTSGTKVVTVEQWVYTYNHGPREPRGWKYGVVVRNDGPGRASFEIHVADLSGL
jgi:hypothetical protein